MWTALYMPGNSDNDPTRNGFATEEEAWDWIFDRMCDTCQKDRSRFLAGDEENGSSHPACACEWNVLKTADLDECETFEDVMRASGWTEVIYRRPEQEKGEE